MPSLPETLAKMFGCLPNSVRIPFPACSPRYMSGVSEIIDFLNKSVLHYDGSLVAGMLYIGENINGIFSASLVMPVVRQINDRGEEIILVSFKDRSRLCYSQVTDGKPPTTVATRPARA